MRRSRSWSETPRLSARPKTNISNSSKRERWRLSSSKIRFRPRRPVAPVMAILRFFEFIAFPSPFTAGNPAKTSSLAPSKNSKPAAEQSQRDRCGKHKAPESVQNATVAGQKTAKVLDPPSTLDPGAGQISRPCCCDQNARHRQGRPGAGIQKTSQYLCGDCRGQDSTDGPFNGLVGTYGRGEAVLAEQMAANLAESIEHGDHQVHKLNAARCGKE